MTKRDKNPVPNPGIPFNNLPGLPPEGIKTETVNILKQLLKSSVALAELKGIVRTLPNPSILLNAVILKEASASSEIENVITTHDKLYQAIAAKGVQADPATKEVLRYREALLNGLRFIRKRSFLSSNAILDIQRILEENNAGFRKLPGTALRTAATGKVIYTPPDEVHVINRLMANFERYLNDEDDVPPLIRMAIQHYQFETIHPFYDGNGRTGRIINTLYLVLSGQIDDPVLYLSHYIIEHKSEYYRLLQEVRTKHNWEGWILFMLRCIESTAKSTVAQVNDINRLFTKTQDIVRKKAPKSYSKELVELLFEQPYCKNEFLVKRLGITRITASKYLKDLEKAGILKSRTVWKETLYINTGLFNLLKK